MRWWVWDGNSETGPHASDEISDMCITGVIDIDTIHLYNATVHDEWVRADEARIPRPRTRSIAVDLEWYTSAVEGKVEGPFLTGHIRHWLSRGRLRGCRVMEAAGGEWWQADCFEEAVAAAVAWHAERERSLSAARAGHSFGSGLLDKIRKRNAKLRSESLELGPMWASRIS